MKINELKTNDPIEVVEVTSHMIKPTGPGMLPESNPKIYEFTKIHMKIFTDGEIDSITEEASKVINEYYIGEEKYEYGVDTLKTRKLYLKNYTYAIVYLIANEYRHIGSISGLFDITKDVQVYLNDVTNKKDLKEVKRVINEISRCNSSVDYTSLFSFFLSSTFGITIRNFNIEEKSKNVYNLRKKNSI